MTGHQDEATVGDVFVAFMPAGKRGRVPAGTSVLDAARGLGVDLDSVCGGRGICGRCQVQVSEGSFAKLGVESSAAALSPCGATEERYRGLRGLAADRRLGCQATLRADAVIDVPSESQVHRQLVRKEERLRAVAVDPVVHLHYVEVAEPDMHDPASDFRRLLAALEAQWKLAGLRAGVGVIAGLQKTLRAGGWKVTAAVRHGREIVAVWPGLREQAHGVAVDIGSTTIAAHLCDLVTGDVVASAGAMNPQIRLGEDLMSRVSYVMMHPGGEVELTTLVRGAVRELIGELVARAGLAAGDVLEVTIVGNPIMHHLFLGFDPTELGGAPFALTVDEGLDIPARDVGLDLAPGAHVFALPCIAGHVGADTAGMVLAEAPHLGDEIALLVDVGTNAEIVLGNRERLYACSSPTGPAFEGAQISCGQRAAPGAIERLRIDPLTLEPRYRVIGSELWSDDPGFAAATARTGVTGICGSGIIEVIVEMALAGIITSEGLIDGALAARSPRIVAEGRTFAYVLREAEPRLLITQQDVRAIQLAKAALYAGIKLLMDRYGVSRVDRITLAGAFGSHIDVKYAMGLGLIPDCDLARAAPGANAAGTGARIALVNAAARLEIGDVVRRIAKIETALEPAFQGHFVDAMAIPHRTDRFDSLAGVFAFPPSRAPDPDRPRTRRGGRARG
ncbi:MAG: DUF4445 domain-containing protein [Alphaproteobacteria bacterium]|nr:DUF4445 domain-containing protein [Alphaproteobacteria bacterium]